MIPESKFLEIAKGLLEKTRQRKARWEEQPGDQGAFVLRLRNASIRIKLFSPPTEMDSISLMLLNEEGKEVGSWTVQDGEQHWGVISELYHEVITNLRGRDKVLEEVEAFLNSE
jgi:hypothetical protein